MFDIESGLKSMESLAKRKRAALALVESCDIEYAAIENGIAEFCAELSSLAKSKTPDLATRIEEDYIVGESIVLRMMTAGRYETHPGSICYSDSLKHIDTLEAKIAYAAWLRWAAGMEEWKEAHPVPDGFWWNGTDLKYHRPR